MTIATSATESTPQNHPVAQKRRAIAIDEEGDRISKKREMAIAAHQNGDRHLCDGINTPESSNSNQEKSDRN
ncbi:MAG: hypothetical protein F6K19_19970 [Cyanothece sp. SIO1E1]|nr:hypothetical protein [Cyanothece sp. SIO1E1]